MLQASLDKMTTSAVNAVKQVLKVETAGPTQTEDHKLSMNAVDDLDDSKSMLAAVWNGKKTVDVVTRPVPKITDPVSITSAVLAWCLMLLCDCIPIRMYASCSQPNSVWLCLRRLLLTHIRC